MNKIKIYKLIFIGQLIINLPIISVILGMTYISINVFDDILLKIILGIISFLISIIITWKYWSLAITKWRLWAFNSVNEKDLLLLKRLAIDTKLIWEDKHDFEYTEGRSIAEAREIYSINRDIYEYEQIENLITSVNTPEEIGFKLSKIQNITESVIMILLIPVGIYMLFLDAYPLGIIILAFLLYDIKRLKYFSYSFKNDNYLRLNSKGVIIGFKSKTTLLSWKHIISIKFEKENREIIIKTTNGKKTKFDLWRLDAYNYYSFRKILVVFIERNNNKIDY